VGGEEGLEVHCRGKLGVLAFRLNEMRQFDALLGSSWEEAGWFGLCSSQNDSIKLSVLSSSKASSQLTPYPDPSDLIRLEISKGAVLVNLPATETFRCSMLFGFQF
jgi:hypothetical protein